MLKLFVNLYDIFYERKTGKKNPRKSCGIRIYGDNIMELRD